MLILLIGARGSGKTSLGRRLADARDLAFVDLDDRALGRFEEESIRAVWAAHGEHAWRAAEVEAVREMIAATGGPGCVVALGGGTPMIEEARALIEAARDRGGVRVVYLRCSVPVLMERLAGAPGDRPGLTGAGVSTEVGSVLAAREATYEALADHVYDNDGNQGIAVEELARLLWDRVGRARPPRGVDRGDACG